MKAESKIIPSHCTIVEEPLSDNSRVYNVRIDLEIVYCLSYANAVEFAKTFNEAVEKAGYTT